MLLIKDLSARLPYAVTIEHTSGFRGTLHDIVIHHKYDDNDDVYDAICYTNFFGDEDSIYIECFKPYLFPLSSMTEEQKSYLYFNTKFELDRFGDLTVQIDEDGNYFYTDASDCTSLIDWLNKNHFDYRGLIPKGLAIDATGLNIY